MIKRKKPIIAAGKWNPPAIVHFVLRSEEIPTFIGPTSRSGVGLMGETEQFTIGELLFSKPSHETELYRDRIDIAPSAAALAAIDQALDAIESHSDFLRSLSSGKRMVVRGSAVAPEGFANKPFVLFPQPGRP